MRTLADMPAEVKAKLPSKVVAAMDIFSSDEQKEIKVFYSYETGLFDCLGFVGPGGKVTKPGNIEKYKALITLEDHTKRELGIL